MSLIDQILSAGSEVVVMSTADWETLKREVRTETGSEVTGNKLWGVDVEVSDMWVGPPKAFSRSEAETFRSKSRLADFRTTPVRM